MPLASWARTLSSIRWHTRTVPSRVGRKPRSRNKASHRLQTFLDGVFDDALADDAFRADLLHRIKSFDLDSKVLLRLIEYWAGAPTKQHNHQHAVSLASLIAGTAREDDDELEGAA
jgi:hypothetical protein